MTSQKVWCHSGWTECSMAGWKVSFTCLCVVLCLSLQSVHIRQSIVFMQRMVSGAQMAAAVLGPQPMEWWNMSLTSPRHLGSGLPAFLINWKLRILLNKCQLDQWAHGEPQGLQVVVDCWLVLSFERPLVTAAKPLAFVPSIISNFVVSNLSSSDDRGVILTTMHC